LKEKFGTNRELLFPVNIYMQVVRRLINVAWDIGTPWNLDHGGYMDVVCHMRVDPIHGHDPRRRVKV